jgi:TPR repeat protein
MILRYLLRLLLLAALLIAAPARADFNDGVVAYLMGDYQTAYNTMRSLAETADHGYAQYYLGMMYLNGQGVEQSYEDAGTWFRKAAEHSIPQAQYRLGTLYFNGQGLPRDYEYAYAWFSTGAVHGHQKSIESVADARSRLSPEELKEAEKLSEKFIRDYGPKEEPGQPVEIKPE